MLSIRKTKTASGAIAVQVVRYENRKVIIEKHIGSAHTPDEIAARIECAAAWIAKNTSQASLFPKVSRKTLSLTTAHYIGTTHTFAHTTLSAVAERSGFTALNNPLLLDLAFMRLIEPASKLRSIVLLERYFGIRYAERSVYRALPKLKKYKEESEKIAVACATKLLSQDLCLVLYDVTTLYFETFDADDLRVPGFSKDNKSQQPQIVVGLLVTREGFPLGWEVFKGNTFEGKTMIPVLDAFAAAHKVATPTVVADAAMLSYANITELSSRGMSYIVGARLGNIKPALIKELSVALEQKDGATIRKTTDHGDLICSFSSKRFRKDKAEMERQIEKGKALITRHEPGKRAKFVKRSGKDEYELNNALIVKATLLLGLKGYYTNIPSAKLSNSDVIAKYHDLWHVEQAFRIAKSDLATRPIFHHKEDAIKAHMVICFVALALGKYLEIMTGLSVRRIVDTLWCVTDARIIDSVTEETFTLRSKIGEDARILLKKLRLSY
jgi:hypothetical protein